jgi:hypothetical protein
MLDFEFVTSPINVLQLLNQVLWGNGERACPQECLLIQSYEQVVDLD